MRRFINMVLSSLVSVSKGRPWLQKRARMQRKEEGKSKASHRTTKMILTVFLSDNQQLLTEVPITPETICKDVVEFCKEAGESSCHLAESWRGKERAIPFDQLMFEYLQKWGQRCQEVKFFLRHEDSPITNISQGGPISEQTNRKCRENADKPCEKGVGNPCVELTLSELQEMAMRQQQQIEAQQQMLMAKEQRLRYLKQQDHHQGQSVSESEKLQRLRERVDSQEAKLKKVRAMRGQVDYTKLINGNLSAEIEHVSSLFQEKQAELQSAMLKVDQLTQQLDDLRRGRLNGLQPLGGPVTGNAALELRKLYQELQIRNKLNQEQNSKLQQHKDILNKRNMEVTMMDKRIGDLRQRLYKKKAELGRMSGPPSPQPTSGSSGRVAAVCPYIQVPVPGRPEGGYNLPPDPLKTQSLTAPSTINHPRSKSANNANWPSFSNSRVLLKPPDWKDTSQDPTSKMGTSDKEAPKLLGTVTALSKQPPPIYGTYPSTGHHSTVCATSSLPRSAPGNLAWQRAPPAACSSSQQIQHRITVPPSPTPGSALFPQGERTEPPLAVAVRPFIPDRGSRPQSPRKGPATMNSSSIYNMYLHQSTSKNYSSSSRAAVKAVYGKPVLPGSTSPSPVPPYQSSRDEVDREADQESAPLPPPSVENIPRPLSPTKLTPVAHSPLRYQSDIDLEVLRRKLANAPRPLKKRSSITEPEGPTGPNIQKLLYQRFNTLAGGIEGGVSGTPFYQPDSPLSYMVTALGDVDTANGNQMEFNMLAGPSTEMTIPDPPTTSSTSPTVDDNENQLMHTSTESDGTQSANASGPSNKDTPEDNHNNNHTSVTDTQHSPAPEAHSPAEQDTTTQSDSSTCAPMVKRTNLKKLGSERTGHGLRVKFNPLALLLDASLEGEFDLVQRIIYEVENPSTPNDEGITPLHNSVCAGHHHIVKFLLDFGVNVNAADSDGWTPLHCAASCNNVHLCKLLVESGAAIFATTISDVETAANKCEEMEEGYIQCSQFLYGVQEKLGVMNKGTVYALWDYEAQSADELSFREGDALTVMSRRDDSETEWWWARFNDKEGYVPRNLLGLYPRIKPRQRSLA
ncbi:protein phosphatase 1, regulatory subunit 13Ba isoform X3 [Xyrauchen texanus]|uniref:protein phosphatase 1, regulatory subunit 13Ba isoform X3 n=1 Tax=Xyrauchen texanus TaxID=154827 RepID=UPI0022419269|nr:protein phosphatase 1, regulatory subunit 13Ba isoform X3 [Xyrauchen texanus]